MEKKITVGIDINYDRITGSYMDKVTHNAIKPLMKEYFAPTISVKDNEIKQSEPKYKPGFSTKYLSNIISNSEEMQETKTKLFNKEFNLIDEIYLQTFFKLYAEEIVQIVQIFLQEKEY